MQNLPLEPMNYKQSLKSEETELLAKCRIVRYRLNNKKPEAEIALAFGMTRNSVGNTVRAFKTLISPEKQKIILEDSLIQETLLSLLSPLKNKKRAPKTNKRSASPAQEKLVLKLFNEKGMCYGYKRFWQTIQRMLGHDPPKELMPLKTITYSQIRGIYKRNALRVKKVRTKNRSQRALYVYPSLACFQYLHIDTKEILDQKALPIEIYEKFKINPELPIFEWNVIDAKTRTRFIAYSHQRTSEFGFHFLLFVVSFIRTQNLILPHIRIKIGMDNGYEFCLGSEKKEAEWNSHFNLINAEVYSYNPHFDVRKNLIERSHLSDDQEFFVPRAYAMNDESSFLAEAAQYNYYWNALRPHSGKHMDGCTPLEKLKNCGVSAPERILLFPTLLLDKHIGIVRQMSDFIRFEKDFCNTNLSSQKEFAELKYRFKNYEYAQNVLTQYLIYPMLTCFIPCLHSIL